MPFDEGRVQLISSVLTAMQIYWCSAFNLPDAIIKDIEKILRGFLWCQGDLKRGKAKLRWDDLCMPKIEGGLGIKRLKYWNIALMTSHIWSIISNKHTLWVQWIHSYRLSNRHFWDVPIPANASWTWFDTWSSIGPIAEVVSRRDIAAIGLQSNAKGDVIRWKKDDSSLHVFSVSHVWESIRPRAIEFDWFLVVWFSQCIPRHAFLMWLLMGERLKTHLKSWEILQGVLLSSKVWGRASCMIRLPINSNNWIFKKSHRTEVKLFDDIYSTVRLKLLSIRFKRSRGVDDMKTDWHM
ncbi:uncharacterized mitochondrial protein AtMg00310-like [Rutidosis leptorrhynchoides]|uniref:uncharacterized mitochondrial protein AtMg00310-like n=1 Tax=Rutidosis leptorrhynchoides TaxID=125765 RepID=UPI003A99E5C9